MLTVHAEMEGRGLAPTFERLLDACLDRGVTFVRLIDQAERLLESPDLIPEAEVVRAARPGRPGLVSCQK